MADKSKMRDVSQMLLFPAEASQEEQESNTSQTESELARGREANAKENDKTGRKAYTAWHPLFAAILGAYLPEGYRLQAEYELTSAPQRIDVVVWEGESKHGKIRGLPAITEHLTRHNLFEFKSPLDDVEAGDYTKLAGYAMNYRNKERKNSTFMMEELSLFLVAPKWTEGLQQDMKEWGLQAQAIQPGVYKLDEHRWKSWFLESNVLGEQRDNEALGLFSEQFAKDARGWSQRRSIPTDMIIWLTQQLARYRERSHDMPLMYDEEFQKEIQKAVREYVASLDNKELQLAIAGEKRQSFLLSLPPEDRLVGLPVEEVLKAVPVEEVLKAVPIAERLKDVPIEERLKDVPVEEVLKAVPIGERLKGLTPEERAALKKLLD